MTWLFFVVALAAGAANPFQSGLNAQLNKQLGSPIWAGLTVYATGLAGMMLLQLVLRQALPGSRLADVNGWAWLGGLVSIASTMAGLMLAQRLGAGVFTGLSITAAVLVSALLDQFGWIGFRQHALSPMRTLGCGLMIAGVWLVSRF
jgi:transporter family-2 protein